MYDIIFNGISASSLGIYVVKRPDYPEVTEKKETYNIPSRDGILYSHTELYDDAEIEVPVNFMAEDENSFGIMCRKLNAWVIGMYNKKLEFSDDSNFFRKVKYAKTSVIQRSGRLGNTEIKFVCDPYMYLVNSDQFQSFSGSITNNYMLSKPVYKIEGNGLCVLKKDAKEFQIQVPGTIWVDSEKMIAYTEDKVANTNVQGFYSTLFLGPGINTFSITAGFNVMIAPYWRTL